MDIFAITIDGKLQSDAFTSLSGACNAHNLGYQSAVKGKRIWVEDAKVTIIHVLTINKIEGRGQDIVGKKPENFDNQEY